MRKTILANISYITAYFSKYLFSYYSLVQGISDIQGLEVLPLSAS